MNGFLTGSLALIVIYVLLQTESVKKIEEGGNVFSSGIKRLLSDQVAGISQKNAALQVKPSSRSSESSTVTV